MTTYAFVYGNENGIGVYQTRATDLETAIEAYESSDHSDLSGPFIVGEIDDSHMMILGHYQFTTAKRNWKKVF